MRDELCEPLSLLPSRSDPWIGITKPSKSCVKEFICGRSVPAGTLSVEGPAKNEFRRTILFSSHPPEPMVHERRLPDTGPGDYRDNVYAVICPRFIQESNILLSPKNIASRNGQPCYRNFL